MVRARRQYHHHNNHHRHPLGHVYRHKRPSQVPSAPNNTTQFIMNDHESIEPDFDLMHHAIMEHYNRNKKRKTQHVASELEAASTTTITTTITTTNNNNSSSSNNNNKLAADQATTTTSTTSSVPSPNTASATPLSSAPTTTTSSLAHNYGAQAAIEQSENSPSQAALVAANAAAALSTKAAPTARAASRTTSTNITANAQPTYLQESIIKSNPTTPSYRPTGSPGDEDGMSPFVNHEHLQSEFQEVYANIHTERLSSMSKNQLVNQYLLLEERVEELENQLRKSQTSASHG